MLTVDAREAKQRFGKLLDTARREPVGIKKHGRLVVVILAVEEYERLAKMEKLMRRKKTPGVKRIRRSIRAKHQSRAKSR